MSTTQLLSFILPFLLPVIVHAQASGSGTTTRYWDCCKASCGWNGKATLASGSNPVSSCDISNNPLSNYNAVSYCASSAGTAYMCGSQTPWAVSSTLSYGFAATSVSGGTEASWCCACYQLTFTSGPVAGKQMIVQATNTGGDLGSNHFDLAIPGGGFGIFNACTNQYPSTPASAWGAQYGGITSRSQCAAFPAALQAGCYWRFDWFLNADNPNMSFKQVSCPAALTARSGCVRANDGINESPTGPSAVPTWAGSTGVSTPITTSTSAGGGTTVTSATTSGAGSGGTGVPVLRYGQCGGIDYLGSTAVS
ncbi:glycoside hydrolase family 45 protein [Sclerotinia borealis F-4128]|uniref:Cellulase n=1 Tax=Sclerotinia borealis (strain F-4128) TaxID=1432307 RepID=W9CKH6_SCLBF|nr:glycoside hydrolase family 45 protein [Sclerotinia borealis F-4128]